MKTKNLLIVAGLLFCFFACKKELGQSHSVYHGTTLIYTGQGYKTGITNTDTITPGTIITGIWKLVSDSTFRGAGEINNAYNYQGKPADYFDFRTDGYVYTQEDGVLDTFSYNYHLPEDTSLYMANITADGVPKNFHISTFTAHSFVGATQIYATPGGEFGRKITLSR